MYIFCFVLAGSNLPCRGQRQYSPDTLPKPPRFASFDLSRHRSRAGIVGSRLVLGSRFASFRPEDRHRHDHHHRNHHHRHPRVRKGGISRLCHSPPPLSMGRRSFATSLTFLLCVCRGPIPDAQYKPKIAVQTFWQQHASFFDKQFGFGVVSPKF